MDQRELAHLKTVLFRIKQLEYLTTLWEKEAQYWSNNNPQNQVIADTFINCANKVKELITIDNELIVNPCKCEQPKLWGYEFCIDCYKNNIL